MDNFRRLLSKDEITGVLMDSNSVGQPVKGLYVPITTLDINNSVNITLLASFEIPNYGNTVPIGLMNGTTFLLRGVLDTVYDSAHVGSWFLHVIAPSEKPLLFYGEKSTTSISLSELNTYTILCVSSPIGDYVDNSGNASNFYNNSRIPLSTYFPELLDKYVYVPLDIWYTRYSTVNIPMSFTVSSVAENTGNTPIYYEPAD